MDFIVKYFSLERFEECINKMCSMGYELHSWQVREVMRGGGNISPYIEGQAIVLFRKAKE